MAPTGRRADGTIRLVVTESVLLSRLRARLLERADPAVKVWWEGYVKDSAHFLGVKMPEIRRLLHAWHREEAAALAPDEQLDRALALIGQAHTEEKLAGMILLQEILLPAGAIDGRRDLKRFERLFTAGHLADWNVCDWFCVKVLGPLIAREGEPCARAISAWREAENLWQARASAVAFVRVADERAYHPLIAASCTSLIRREERFAKTAVGWILRDVSKQDRDLVLGFVDRHLASFSIESLRNALKYLGPQDKEVRVARFKALRR